jgi:hypothetical protein
LIALYGIVCFFAGVGFGCWGAAVYLSHQRDGQEKFTEPLLVAAIGGVFLIGTVAVAVILQASRQIPVYDLEQIKAAWRTNITDERIPNTVGP